MSKIIIKSIAIVSGIYGLIMTIRSLLTMTYFTILSNIFIIIMLGLFLIKDIKNYKSEIVKYKNGMYITKFLATISISLTFFVFMFLLAPTMEGGFIAAYRGYHYESFCLHFLTPILAIIDFLLFDTEYRHKKIHAFYSIIPPLGYTLFVIILSLFGVRWGNMHAPYNFMNFGAPTGWFGINLSLISFETLGIGVFYMLVILIIIFLLLELLLLKIKRKN